MKWTTTQLIAAGAMGALFAITAMSEIPLNVITGIPGMGGVIGSFFELIVFTIAILLIPKFGTGAIVGGIGMAIVLPLPVFGPPGFLPKVFIGFVFGLFYDLLYLFFKRYGKWGIVCNGVVITLLATAGGTYVLSLFDLAAFGSLSFKFALLLTLIFLVEVAIGSLVGWHLFQKLKNTAVVRRIEGS